jgi:hypothetical protein
MVFSSVEQLSGELAAEAAVDPGEAEELARRLSRTYPPARALADFAAAAFG